MRLPAVMYTINRDIRRAVHLFKCAARFNRLPQTPRPSVVEIAVEVVPGQDNICELVRSREIGKRQDKFVDSGLIVVIIKFGRYREAAGLASGIQE